MTKTPPVPAVRLAPEMRRKALLQGLGAAVGSVAFIFLIGYGSKLIDPKPVQIQTIWYRSLVSFICILGELITVVGMWRLSIARDQRWDLPGVFALLVIWACVLPCLFWMFLTVTALTGATLYGGK